MLGVLGLPTAGLAADDQRLRKAAARWVANQPQKDEDLVLALSIQVLVGGFGHRVYVWWQLRSLDSVLALVEMHLLQNRVEISGARWHRWAVMTGHWLLGIYGNQNFRNTDETMKKI